MRSTFSLLPYINRSKVRADGTTAVLCRITIDGKQTAISTGIYCRPEDWNGRKNEIKTVRENNRLREYLRLTEEAYTEILKSQGVVSAEMLKNHISLNNIHPTTLLQMGEWERERLKKHSEEIDSTSSYRHSMYYQKYLTDFIASIGKKEIPLDFALWNAAKEGEPYWQSPWGKGRPGWHIECSAMNKRYLGDTIDIHCGGQDLIFPHHENEIAQSECANGCTFSKYWMHNGYINVDNVKMSKSLGNFKTVREIANVYGYEVIRYFLVSSHYRSPINYSLEIIEQCKSALERLYTCRESLDFAIKNAKDIADDAELINRINSRREQFIEAMDDDLNTADGVAAIFDLVKDINISILDKEVSKNVCQTAADVFDELCDVLGILYNRKSNDVDADIEALIEQRQTARANKDWATADRIRDELKAKGIILKDTPQGVTWTKE